MATVKKSSSAKLTQEAVVVKTTVTTVTKKQVKQPAGAGIGRLGYTVVLLSLLVPLVLWMRSPSEDAAIITYPLAVNATAGTTNPNGCRMPATFFVSTQYTNYHMVQMLYKSGHEIACHTMTHVGNAMTPEINGSRAAINGIISEDGSWRSDL
ncbi:hypothetical protein HKX48_000684 [Thoreauomyces humboldtii]|nr:hypothetical protein HKX48_000684 [Thoreauomyces humboldtii]